MLDEQATAHGQVAPEYGESMSWERVGGHFTLVHAACPIVAHEWNRYSEVLRANPPEGILVLVPPGCPGPAADQRRTLGDAVKQAGQPPVAVLTHATLHRHLITAMNWLSGGSMTAFAPDDLEAALAHVRVGAQERDALLTATARLARRMRVLELFPALG